MALPENPQDRESLINYYMARLPEHEEAFRQKGLAIKNGHNQKSWARDCGWGTVPLVGRRSGPLEEGEFKSFVEVNLGFPDRIERVIECDIPEDKMIIPWECGD